MYYRLGFAVFLLWVLDLLVYYRLVNWLVIIIHQPNRPNNSVKPNVGKPTLVVWLRFLILAN